MRTKKQSIFLEQRVQRFMQDSCLLPENACLLLAVSGGVDSTCLLHLLAALRQGFGIRLHVVHLDHKLRGTESAADADYVRDLADSLDIPLECYLVAESLSRSHSSP